MTKKNKYIFTALAVVAAITTTVAVTQSINQKIKPSSAECPHTGRIYHQVATKASGDTPGEREYWACCDCNDAFDSYDEDEHIVGNKIGNTVNDRTNLEVYDIDWTTPRFGESEDKSLYDIVKDCGGVYYSSGGLATPIDCGETPDDKVYYQINDVEGTKTIAFYVEGGRKARADDFDVENTGLFEDCDKLTVLDVNFLDTSSITNFRRMFYNCSLLEGLDVSAFDTMSAVTFDSMFACDEIDTNLKQIVGLHKFRTTNVTCLDNMFQNRQGLIKLSLLGFDTANCYQYSNMFDNCSSLTTIYTDDKFAIPDGSTSDNMFAACGSLVGGNGTSWSEEHTDGEYAVIDNEEHAGYFTGLPDYEVLPNYLYIVKDIMQEMQPAIGWYRGAQLPGDLTINSHYIKDGYPYDINLIQYGGFEDSETLTSVTIGKEFTAIPRNAFKNCSVLGDVFFEDESQITTISEMSFCECPELRQLPIPDTVTEIKGNPCPNSPEVNFAVSEENEFFTTKFDGTALLNKNETRLISYPAANGEFDLNAKFGNVTEISKYCFHGNNNLTSVISLPDSLKVIEEGAFQNCSNLESFAAIPRTAIKIGAYAFAGDTSLSELFFVDQDNWYCGDDYAYVDNDYPDATAYNLTSSDKAWCTNGLIKPIDIVLEEKDVGTGTYIFEDSSSYSKGSKLNISSQPSGESFTPSSLFFQTVGAGVSLYKISLTDDSQDIRILSVVNSDDVDLEPGTDYYVGGYENDQLIFSNEAALTCADGLTVYCQITSENVNSLCIQLYAA